MSEVFEGVALSSGGFRCSECSKEFSKRFSLERHYRVIHLNERPYRCICGKTFATKEQESRHFIAKHTDSKPFPCERGCEKAFASINARSYHYKVYHDQERYSCPFAWCSKAFTSQKHLRNHMSKPHVCNTELANEIKDKTKTIGMLRKEIEVLKQANLQLNSIVCKEKDFSSDLLTMPLDEQEPEDWVNLLTD